MKALLHGRAYAAGIMLGMEFSAASVLCHQAVLETTVKKPDGLRSGKYATALALISTMVLQMEVHLA